MLGVLEKKPDFRLKNNCANPELFLKIHLVFSFDK